MTCQAGAERVKGAARKSGVSSTSGQGAFVAGSSSQAGFFVTQQRIAARVEKRARQNQARKKNQSLTASRRKEQAGESTPAPIRSLPGQGQINVTGQFSGEELQRLSLHLRLGAAALARHIRELNSRAPRGLGQRDPRPLDWAQLDQEQYRFLIDQMAEARRGRGYLDTGGLNTDQRVELWRFARFEADRALRNIDHLATPGNSVRPIGGSATGSPTADYLSAGHKLDARFYTYLANQLETSVPANRLRVGEIE